MTQYSTVQYSTEYDVLYSTDYCLLRRRWNRGRRSVPCHAHAHGPVAPHLHLTAPAIGAQGQVQ